MAEYGSVIFKCSNKPDMVLPFHITEDQILKKSVIDYIVLMKEMKK